MSYVFTLTACMVYFTLTFLLWMKAKWREAFYFTPQPSLYVLIGCFALLGIYYFYWVLRAYYADYSHGTVSEGLWVILLTLLPVYCLVYAPLPAFRYKGHILWLMAGLTFLCMTGVLVGSLIAGTLSGWSSLIQKTVSAVCLSALACGVIPFGVLYRSNDLSKKLYHNVLGGYRWIFLGFWCATCATYVFMLLGKEVCLQVYVSLAMPVHVWMLWPVLRAGREGGMTMQDKYEREYAKNNLLANSSWAVLEEASQIVERTEDAFYNKLETYMRNEKPFLKSEVSRTLVAAAIGTNASYLSRIISTRDKTSFAQYVNKHRVYFAQEYYRTHPGATLMDLCIEAGFRSMASFNLAFRAYIGMTPGQWCKQLVV